MVAIRIRMQAIQKAVCVYYKLDMEDLLGANRVRGFSRPRMVAMYLCRKLTSNSLPQIGRAFNRDHTTVLSAVRNVTGLIDTDGETRRAVLLIAKTLINDSVDADLQALNKDAA